MNTDTTILKTKSLPKNAELRLAELNDTQDERRYYVYKMVNDHTYRTIPTDTDATKREVYNETADYLRVLSNGRTYNDAVKLFDSYNEYSVTIEVTYTSQDINDLMVAALEGGITYWCYKAEVDRKGYKGYLSDALTHGYSIYLYDNDTGLRQQLTLEQLLKGIELYAANKGFLMHGREIDWCNVDADAADCIVQFALFGEVIYG